MFSMAYVELGTTCPAERGQVKSLLANLRPPTLDLIFKEFGHLDFLYIHSHTHAHIALNHMELAYMIMKTRKTPNLQT